MNNQELWQSVLAQMQLNISKANFATWFQNTEIVSKEAEKVIISVPNAFSKEWLSNKYNKSILKTLHDIDDSIKELEFIIKPQSVKIITHSSGIIKGSIVLFEIVYECYVCFRFGADI